MQMLRVMVMALSACCWFAAAADAEVRTREIEYKQGEMVLQGLLAWDDAVKERRPGVLVVHEWWGHNEHVREQAKRLAAAGYVGFALDMFGKGKVTTHPKEAQAFMTEAQNDPATMSARFAAAVEQLKQDPHVDREQVAAIGYCFGGAVVLNQARSGVDLDGVVSFHGMLSTKTPAERGKVKAKMLVLTGANDPFVPAEQVDGFVKEMKAAGAHFQVITLQNAKHGFTNPNAGKAGLDALEYNAEADNQSWAAMLGFFKEVFPSRH